MCTNRNFYYKQKSLENYLKGCKNNLENLSLIANYLKEQTRENIIDIEEKTKEQLYALGFDALNICKYFVCCNEKKWRLKKYLLINKIEITNIETLLKVLNLTSYKNTI